METGSQLKVKGKLLTSLMDALFMILKLSQEIVAVQYLFCLMNKSSKYARYTKEISMASAIRVP
jgi:hypothetical protein